MAYHVGCWFSQGVAQPIPLSSLDLGFCLCLSCSPDFFVCDFVLPFDVKDGPQASVNESALCMLRPLLRARFHMRKEGLTLRWC